MSEMGVGLLIEEHREEIQQAWTGSVDAELAGERALEFAVGPLLREMSVALRGDAAPSSSSHPPDPFGRCAVLVRAAASPARLAREFKLLHRAIWDTLRRAGRIVPLEERRSADEWLDEGLAAALERSDRVRARFDLAERVPAATPPPALTQRQLPPPLPWNRGAKEPPAAAVD